MISTQYPSRNGKTGPIATTYRSGALPFATCPATCKLCDKPEQAAQRIDHDYMRAVYESVPAGGRAFTYSHFRWQQWAHKYPAKKGRATINYSADTMRLAKAALAAGVPTTVALTEETAAKEKKAGTRLLICPADKEKGRTCANCGGSKGPICARGNRDFMVGFLVHGKDKRKAADLTTPGGCYGWSGYYTRLAWQNLSDTQATNDATQHRAFVDRLPYGTTLRAHIVGDMGKM